MSPGEKLMRVIGHNGQPHHAAHPVGTVLPMVDGQLPGGWVASGGHHRCEPVEEQAAGVRLADATPGIYRGASGGLLLVTQYSTDGSPDAYVVETGEYWWGGHSSRAARHVAVIVPVDLSPLSRPGVGGQG